MSDSPMKTVYVSPKNSAIAGFVSTYTSRMYEVPCWRNVWLNSSSLKRRVTILKSDLTQFPTDGKIAASVTADENVISQGRIRQGWLLLSVHCLRRAVCVADVRASTATGS